MTDALPAILEEIAGVIGHAGALKIAAQFGGTRVYFPTKVNVVESHRLVECVGMEAAQKLCDHFSADGRGQRVDIPLFGGSYQQLLGQIARGVRNLHNEEDASVSQTARRLGISQRTVHRHRKRWKERAEAEKKQPRLL